MRTHCSYAAKKKDRKLKLSVPSFEESPSRSEEPLRRHRNKVSLRGHRGGQVWEGWVIRLEIGGENTCKKAPGKAKTPAQKKIVLLVKKRAPGPICK